MLVVVHHIHIRFRINGFKVTPFLPDGLWQVLVGTGYYAVICFFVISGFLITRLSLRRWSSLQQMEPLKFYGLRAARILPLLLLVVAASSLLHLLSVTPFVIRPDRGTLGGAVFAALGFHVNWYEGTHGYLAGNWDVMWSLSVEETFYLLFPLVCLALRSRLALLLGLLPLIVVGPFYRFCVRDLDPWGDYAYLCCMDGIALGCIAGWLSERHRLGAVAARIAMLVGAAAVVLVIAFPDTTGRLGLHATELDVTVIELGMALVLLGMAAGTGAVAMSRGTSLLRAAGRCSYEIYLTHMFVVFSFFLAHDAVYGKGKPSPVPYFAWYALILVLSVLFGYAVARWFSEPANRALRRRFGPPGE
jgi:peptidoglycan/LPS O-acetylase OafA/YrhL